MYDDNEEYERIHADLRSSPDRADVIVVVRRPDGSETRAATFYGAAVSLLMVPSEPHWMQPTTRLPDPDICQLTVTTDRGVTVYDPSYFSKRREIGGGF